MTKKSNTSSIVTYTTLEYVELRGCLNRSLVSNANQSKMLSQSWTYKLNDYLMHIIHVYDSKDHYEHYT